jgi:MoaA/NifB/PqqE/SkfB family radical SAM enzyme
MIDAIKGFNFTKDEIAKAIKNNELLQISVNISRKCNFHCLYCLMDGGTPRENELTNDEIKNVLKEANKLGAKTWYIAGDGEPLLLDGIDDLIGYANELDMWVVLATNGELLTEKRAAGLKTKNISIITKFNAFDKKIFDHLVQCKSTFVNFDGFYVPRGVASLIKTGYNQDTLTRAGIETVITTKNIDEIPKIYEFAEKHNLYSNIEMMLPIGRAKQHQELIPTDKNIEELYNRLDVETNRCPANDKKDLSHYAGIDCSMRIRYSLYTNSCGDVYLCFSQHPKLSTRMNVRNFAPKDIVARRKFSKIPIKCACAYFSEN